jgi:hypothetical protein
MATKPKKDSGEPKKKTLAERWAEDERYSNPCIQPPPKKKK